jgi:hypothetical protein
MFISANNGYLIDDENLYNIKDIVHANLLIHQSVVDSICLTYQGGVRIHISVDLVKGITPEIILQI